MLILQHTLVAVDTPLSYLHHHFATGSHGIGARADEGVCVMCYVYG